MEVQFPKINNKQFGISIRDEKKRVSNNVFFYFIISNTTHVQKIFVKNKVSKLKVILL